MEYLVHTGMRLCLLFIVHFSLLLKLTHREVVRIIHSPFTLLLVLSHVHATYRVGQMEVYRAKQFILVIVFIVLFLI